MVNLDLIVFWSGFLPFLFALTWTVRDAFVNYRPFDPVYYGIWYILIPWASAINWLLFWGLAEGSWVGESLFLYPIATMVLAATIGLTHRFWGQQQCEHVIQCPYRFWGKSWTEAGFADFYRIAKWSIPIEKILGLIDYDLYYKKERPTGESDEHWARYTDIRTTYLKYRDEIATWKVTALGYFRQSSKLLKNRHRILIYYHKYDIEELGFIPANVVETDERTEFGGKELITYVGFAGLPNDEISQLMEACKAYLNVTAQVEAYEDFQLTKTDNEHLRETVVQYKKELRLVKSRDRSTKWEITGKKPEQKQDQQLAWLPFVKKLGWIVGVLIVALIIITFLLMHFGVI